MPLRVSSVTIRDLPRHCEELKELSERLPYDEYFYQFPPRTLPLLIENDYLRPSFLAFAETQLLEAGFSPDDVNLGYSVVDVTLDPLNEKRPQLSFPFIFTSRFMFEGLRFQGPFMAGHQAGISMVQSSREARYARYLLQEKYAPVFSSEVQTLIIAESVAGIVASVKLTGGAIAGLPDRRRDAEQFTRSNIARVLTGGRITDAVDSEVVDLQRWEKNPLSGRVFKIHQNAFTIDNLPVPPLYNDFTYYSFLHDKLHERLLRDGSFLRLIDVIRRLGPCYRERFPSESQGVLFDPKKNLEVMSELLDRAI